LKQLGKRVITEFNYRYASPSEAHIFVGFKLSEGAAETEVLTAQLRELGYPVTDLSHNEMAKLHVRYMVGGRLPKQQDEQPAAIAAEEQLFRFEFPERPGACLAFLDAIGSAFNISLFHYRNHGAAYGRVLAGLQVPKGKSRECREALDALGYPYWDETSNPAYALFLGSAAKH